MVPCLRDQPINYVGLDGTKFCISFRLKYTFFFFSQKGNVAMLLEKHQVVSRLSALIM